MNAGDILTALGFALAILSGLAAVTTYLRGTAIKADMQRLRDSNGDLRNDVSDRDRRIDELEEAGGRTKAALDRIGKENERLWEKLTNVDEMKQVADLMRAHDNEAAMRHAATYRVLKDIRDSIENRPDPGDRTGRLDRSTDD